MTVDAKFSTIRPRPVQTVTLLGPLRRRRWVELQAGPQRPVDVTIAATAARLATSDRRITCARRISRGSPRVGLLDQG